MITVDTRGRLCPIPLIMLKKALTNCNPGEDVCVLTDNETACGNLTDFISDLKCEVVKKTETTAEGLGYTSLSFKAPTGIAATGTAETCTAPPRKYEEEPYVVVIDSDEMGGGNRELGQLLLRSFVNALIEMPHLPTHVILYNKGVYMALKGTDTAETLQRMNREFGVDIVCCGTCVDFYKVRELLLLGRITNMYTIMELQSKAGHIMRP
ncbi:hypothetical protein HQ47_06085 [Porphyromonas macacae]|uniref:UPF0033 domain-containing protein n=1 Tax=Porphyromonas macacae TaxID=28115 RepID=A0A0A2E8R4_9PORP|nr:sulfurtransferase-like selenium metabolism protein YedF [Porphyromonas macacae]KGN74032.1 hypothetical protein HQ47_06085 [Porphyromonas macacae]